MKFLAPVDLYCERTSSEFWAEPLNAISNVSFIVAGLFGLYLVIHLKRQDNEVFWTQLLAINAIVVGIGSFLFHTLANRWAMIADVVPIMAFMGLFLSFSLYRLLGLSRLLTSAGLVLYFAVVGIAGLVFRDIFNGSVGYFPAWTALAIVGHFLRDKNWPVAKLFLVGMGVLAASLSFRSLDLVFCEMIPIGTHFIWHSLNGVLLAVLIYSSSVYSRGLYHS